MLVDRDRRGAMSGFAHSWLAAILIGLVGLVFVVGPGVSDGQIPGDLGDARFNSYVLEHFYRWITRQDQNFWNAQFFYPFPLTIAFSENYLGTGLIYSLFRVAGFGREDSFRLWFVVGFAINFLAATYSLSRLGYSRPAAALGAFLFSFGLPITAQEGHAQLIYRFGVPLAVLAFVEFDRHKQLSRLSLTALWTTWQFYCSIYLGYFLVLLLAALGLGLTLRGEGGAVASIRRQMLEVREAWGSTSVRARMAFALAMTILAVMMGFLLVPYIEVSRLYGFRRTWADIASMLPRPISYILTGNSIIWPSNLFAALPMRWEHAMFPGIAPFLAIGAAFVLRLRNRGVVDSLFVPVSLAMLLLVLVTIMVHGWSLYRVLAMLPGVSAIQAVTRICTVLLFPLGILLASSADTVLTARLARSARLGIMATIVILLVCEASLIRHGTMTKSDWQARMSAMAAMVPPKVPDEPILLRGPIPGEPSYVPQIDAMLFAQDRGWRTINGYSGNSPPVQVRGQCNDARGDLAAGLDFLGLRSQQDFVALARHVITIGYPACDQTQMQRRPLAGPVPAELMANVRLRIERLVLRDGQVIIQAKIINRSSTILPADSSTGTPVRLSARYVDEHAVATGSVGRSGWDSRQDLTQDVPPDTESAVEIPLPPPLVPGTYRVALSLVQENVAWFHDHGMPIAISAQAVTVERTIRLSNGDSADAGSSGH
jgi:hypothetical protein